MSTTSAPPEAPKIVNVPVDETLHQALKMRAAKERVSMRDIVRGLIRQHVQPELTELQLEPLGQGAKRDLA